MTNSTYLKSVKPGMPNHFSESRDPSYVSSAMFIQNVPGKNGKLSPSSYSLHPLESGGVLAWSRLGVETADLFEIACC